MVSVVSLNNLLLWQLRSDMIGDANFQFAGASLTMFARMQVRSLQAAGADLQPGCG